MDEKLGQITNVDVRKYWQNEATGFTPWLADEENIKMLGDVVGIELEVENTEVAVGPYSADILAKDTSTSEYVVIENQLGKTDHDHLGKSITYASVLNASAIIWIATNFTEEHKKALDWLNENTSEDVSFYGVRLELWKIDSSSPAVKFNLVSWPAKLKRTTVIAKASENLSETRKVQLEFWTELRKKLLDDKIVPSAQNPGPKYWYNIALGRSGIHISCIADTTRNRIGIQVVLRSKVAKPALEELLNQKEQIENEIGEQLIWDRNPNNINKLITLYHSADISNRDLRSKHIDWLGDKVKRFRKAFAPRIKVLKLNG